MSIDLAIALGFIAGHGVATTFWSLWTSGERVEWFAPAVGTALTIVSFVAILALI